jgi:hypothetical protein
MKMMLKFLAVPVILVLGFQFNGCKEKEEPIPPSTIAGFNPTSGEITATVTITGSYFETNPADNVVKFNGIAATVTAATATELTVTVPAGAATGKITVSVRDATATSATDFTVIFPPTITSFTPAMGTFGNNIKITGEHFNTNITKNVVKFNGVTATVTEATATQLTATVPAGATTGKITVTIDPVVGTSATDFTVVPITITSFTPTSGVFESSVTITGNFNANISGNVVKLNGVVATVTAATSTELTIKLTNGGSTGKITVSANDVTAESAGNFTYTKQWFVSDLAGSGVNGAANGTGAAASFSNMTNITIDSAGNVYMADQLNHLIRRITPAGVATTIAGTSQGYQDGPIATAKFDNPVAIAVDANGDIYVADSFNNIIRKVSNGMVTTIAGQQLAGSNNGTGTDARFNNPHGVCVDNTGNLFIADNLNNRIRKITPAGVVTTFAGNGTPGSLDGTGTAATLNNPWGLTIDKDNNLYIADTFGHKIRKITPAGVVTTVAGTDVSGTTDGQGSAARFDRPTGVSADHKGNIFVSDFFNSTVRMITPTGLVTTIGGVAPVTAYANGLGPNARFFNPYSVTNNGAGTIVYVADQGNRRVRKMELK